MENQILEIYLISAHGLKAPPSNLRKMQTYALTWVNSAAKLRTRVDSLGGENPTWNDKFLFRVSPPSPSRSSPSDTSRISSSAPLRFLLSTFLTPHAPAAAESPTRTPAFTAVQIRRSSGRFLGVLNIAAAVYYSDCGQGPGRQFTRIDGEEGAQAAAAQPQRFDAEPTVLRR